jgi:hypothetical protein
MCDARSEKLPISIQAQPGRKVAVASVVMAQYGRDGLTIPVRTIVDSSC